MSTLLRRLALWTFICAVSAAPSFALASDRFDRRAMVVGVCLFILAYTAATSTHAFERFHRRPFVRRTLYIGYGLRLTVSAAFPIGATADIFPGVLSVNCVRALGVDPYSFDGTLAATCIQGTLLNVILSLFMYLIYIVQRIFMRPPEQPRGFPIIPLEPVPLAARSARPPETAVSAGDG